MKNRISVSLINKLLSELDNQAEYGFVKSIHGHFYYTCSQDKQIIPLLLPTRLQKERIEVFVGDIVQIDFQNKNIKSIISRFSLLPRPKVANIDQALIVISASNPEIEPEHLDRLLCHAGIALPEKPIICLTKTDIASVPSICELYQKLDYIIIKLDNSTGKGLDKLIPFLENKTSVLAGASGVGKSSLLNILCPELSLKTGVVSHKTARGTHTTRHSEIFEIQRDGKKFYILDTPGFSRLDAQFGVQEIVIAKAFPEIGLAKQACYFPDCKHRFEEGCQVSFAESRQNSYLKLLQEAERWEQAQLEIKKNKDKKQSTKIKSEINIPLLRSSQRAVSRKTLKQSLELKNKEEEDY